MRPAIDLMHPLACRCAPLYPPAVVYQALMGDTRSRAAACNSSASLPPYPARHRVVTMMPPVCTVHEHRAVHGSSYSDGVMWLT